LRPAPPAGGANRSPGTGSCGKVVCHGFTFKNTHKIDFNEHSFENSENQNSQQIASVRRISGILQRRLGREGYAVKMKNIKFSTPNGLISIYMHPSKEF